MKTELKYDKETNILYQALHGSCSVHNLAEVFDEIESYNPEPGLKILADITDAELIDTNYDSVSFLEQKLDRFLNKFLPIRKAIIVESKLEFGIARMYEMLSERDGFDVQVFYDKNKALHWLNE